MSPSVRILSMGRRDDGMAACTLPAAMRFWKARRLTVNSSIRVLLAAAWLASACGNEPVRRPARTGDSGPGAVGPVAVSLVEAFPGARVFRETGGLDFGDTEASFRLVEGFGRAEEHGATGVTFAWANAQSSVLLVDVAGSDARRIALTGWPYRRPDGVPQTVAMSVNGRQLGTEAIGRIRRRVEFAVPDGVLVPGRNSIRLDYAYVASPADVQPGSRDRRQLAVAFDELELVPAPGDPADSEPRPVEVDGATIHQPAGTALVYDMVGPQDGVLAVSVDLSAEADGTAEMWARPADGNPRLLLRIQAGIDPPETSTVDLADLEGRRFDLVLALSGSRGHVSWREPRVLGVSTPVQRPPNVILIVIDTLRADAVGVYGGEASTPVMDRLAAEGVVFEWARSHSPITGPSHASMFVSEPPFAHGVLNNATLLDREFLTLAEVARSAGRTTAGFVSLGVLHHDWGFDEGFRLYADAFRRDWMKDADEVLPEVSAWLDGSFLDPFLAFVHFSEPHEPYSPPGIDYPRVRVLHDGREVGSVVADGRAHSVILEVPGGESSLRLEVDGAAPGRSFRLPVLRVLGGDIEVRPTVGWAERSGRSGSLRTSFPAAATIVNPESERRGVLVVHCVEELSDEEVRDRYALEVETVDRAIGELLGKLRVRGHLDDAVVIVTSDHGEGLGDHDLIGHIDQLYDSLLRVPLILWSPGRVPAGVRIDEAVALRDLPATVAALADLHAPDRWSGQAVSAIWSGRWEPRPIVLETHTPEAVETLYGVVWDGFKLIRRPSGSPRVELYDLETDPDELDNVAALRPEKVAELESLLDRELATARERAASAELTDEEAP